MVLVNPMPVRDGSSSAKPGPPRAGDRKSTRLNSSHSQISYAVFCLKKKTTMQHHSNQSPDGLIFSSLESLPSCAPVRCATGPVFTSGAAYLHHSRSNVTLILGSSDS